MTARDDKQMRGFFDIVADILGKRKHSGHPIDGMCKSGHCAWCRGEKKAAPAGLLELVAWFWKHGPEVSEGWRLTAIRRGFNPEELHDIMLGAFVGGDRKKPEIDHTGDAQAYVTVIEAGSIDPDKPFRVQIIPPKEPTS